jgi:hypothetical protein
MQAKNIEIEGYTLTADVTFDTHNVGAATIAGSQKVTYISQDAWEDLFLSLFGDTEVEVNGVTTKLYKAKLEAYDKGSLSDSDKEKVTATNKKPFSSLSTTDKVYVSKMTVQYAVQLDASNVPASVDTSGLAKDASGNLEDYNLDTCTVVYEFDKNNMYVTRTYKYMQNLNSTYTGTDDKDKYRYTDALNYVVLGSGVDGDDTTNNITGVIATVDAKNNAMGIDLYFADNNMSYTTNGMIKVRNSYVLSQFE